MELEGEPNPNPVLISKKRAVQKNYRLAEYFLCPTCEETLNKHGETWVLRNAYRGQNHFPMRSALEQAKLISRWNGADLLDVSALPELTPNKK